MTGRNSANTGNSRELRDKLLWFYTSNYSQLTPPQPSGSDLFTETNTRLIECIFCVEKKLRKRFSVQPSVRESEKNGNQDLCSHTADFDTLKAGMRLRGLTSRQSSREPAKPSDGAEPQRSSPQTSQYAAVWDREPQLVRFHQNNGSPQAHDGVQRPFGR